MSRKLPKRKPGQGWKVPARDRTPKERHGGTWWWNAPWRTRQASYAEDAAWCRKEATAIREKGARGKARCPDCGRRLTLMQVDIEQGYGDFWPYLPPHKVPPAKQAKARAAAEATPPAPPAAPAPPRGFKPRPPVARRLNPKERRGLRRQES